MDGEDNQRKKYDPSSYTMVPRLGPQPNRHSSGNPAERFRQQNQGSPASAISMENVVPPQDRSASLSTYASYGYTESPSYNAPPLQSGSLQGGELQYQPDFTSTSSRQGQAQAAQQQAHAQAQPQQPQQQAQRLSPYDTEMVYNIAPQAQAQPSYEAMSHYPQRHSAAIEVLATQFGMPHYFPGEEAGAQSVPSQYLTGQVQPAGYSQTTPVSRPSAAANFPETMTEFNPSMATTEPVETHEAPRESRSGFDEAYNQYQQALRQTFANTRAGRLVEASQSLLEISEWLLGNAVELGLVRDEEELHSDRIKLWDDFNTCWLAVCQKQKDMTEQMLQSGNRPQNLLSEDTLNKMGRDLVRLCDKMEQYGLVDYQMGVWEEEILSVLSQCLDLVEGDNDGEEEDSQTQAQLPSRSR